LKVIPARLRLLEPQILGEYASGDSYATLAYRHQASKSDIGLIVTRAGIQRKAVDPRKHRGANL